MNNFEFYNPTRIIFGTETIGRLQNLIPEDYKILLCYGGGSIKHNGVYDQVITALASSEIVEFGGIESNPDIDTLKKAIELGREKNVDFVLAVGGGSVIDGSKLVAVGIPYQFDNLWDVVTGKVKIKQGEALPLGTVLTLPATASEMNGTSVISRRETEEKYGWSSEAVFPVFSILDPTTTYTLPKEQVRNGIVDAYVHVLEQYITYPVDAQLQDRQAEALLLTLQAVGEKALETPPNYDARANFMWAATNALNKLIAQGVPQDWSTHAIGHELTALYGLSHAESLAVVMPHLFWHQREKKAEKLVQYAQRVWGLEGKGDGVIRTALDMMINYFNKLGMPTKLTDYKVNLQEAAIRISERFNSREQVLGEHKHIKPEDVAEILEMSK